MTFYLVLKGEWFDKIERGEKTHEYRLKKTYWEKRITNLIIKMGEHKGEALYIVLSRGYHKDAPKLKGIITHIGVILDGSQTDLKVNAPVYDIVMQGMKRVK